MSPQPRESQGPQRPQRPQRPAGPPGPQGHEIGTSLRDARRRLGIEVKEVEERTKIRARYIRALENEDWETLPAPAYVRGFIRTYGQMLGLDGEMLADEYRRQSVAFEQVDSPGRPGEPVLTERQRHPDRQLSRGTLLGVLALGLVAVLLLLSLLPGGDEGGEQGGGGMAESGREDVTGRDGAGRGDGGAGVGAGKRGQRDSPPEPLRVERFGFEALTDVTVCLVAGGQARVDNQVLSVGTEESYDDAKRYRVDLVGGEGRVEIAGDRERISADDEGTSFQADSLGIRAIDYKGPRCP